MPPSRLSCPKCNRSMEQGFIVDVAHGYALASKWVKDPPQRSFWRGVKLRGRRQIEVSTYRCTGCGYLESYAAE